MVTAPLYNDNREVSELVDAGWDELLEKPLEKAVVLKPVKQENEVYGMSDSELDYQLPICNRFSTAEAANEFFDNAKPVRAKPVKPVDPAFLRKVFADNLERIKETGPTIEGKEENILNEVYERTEPVYGKHAWQPLSAPEADPNYDVIFDEPIYFNDEELPVVKARLTAGEWSTTVKKAAKERFELDKELEAKRKRALEERFKADKQLESKKEPISPEISLEPLSDAEWEKAIYLQDFFEPISDREWETAVDTALEWAFDYEIAKYRKPVVETVDKVLEWAFPSVEKRYGINFTTETALIRSSARAKVGVTPLPEFTTEVLTDEYIIGPMEPGDFALQEMIELPLDGIFCPMDRVSLPEEISTMPTERIIFLPAKRSDEIVSGDELVNAIDEDLRMAHG